MTSGYCVTDQPCPDCAKDGALEWLYSNGTRFVCSFPWCGYDKTLESKGSDQPECVQPLLL